MENENTEEPKIIRDLFDFKRKSKIYYFTMRWYHRIKDFPKQFIFFIKNIFLFRKELWEFRTWDYHYNIDIFKKSLIPLRDTIYNGYEVEHSRMKKVQKLDRLIYLLDIISKDSFLEVAEKELSMEVVSEMKIDQYGVLQSSVHDESNRKIFDYAHKLEKEYWDEALKIIKGQPVDEMNFENELNYDEYFDGSGIQGWWD